MEREDLLLFSNNNSSTHQMHMQNYLFFSNNRSAILVFNQRTIALYQSPARYRNQRRRSQQSMETETNQRKWFAQKIVRKFETLSNENLAVTIFPIYLFSDSRFKISSTAFPLLLQLQRCPLPTTTLNNPPLSVLESRLPNPLSHLWYSAGRILLSISTA